MKFFQNSFFLLIALNVLASSCSQNSESLTGAEKGVATGAVIGAGLGALVGSTAGEPGVGVVMGSIAGATTGGLIGSSIDGQEERIDRHDKKLGVNTKKRDEKTGRASLKSNLKEDASENEESFLGRNIWNRAPKNGDDPDEGSMVSQLESNTASGKKGEAHRYGQIQRLDRTLEVEDKNSNVEQRAQLRANLSDKPVIELTKPTESGLPKARISRLPESEFTKVGASAVTTLAKTELPPVKKLTPEPALPAAKKTIIEPVKTPQEEVISRKLNEDSKKLESKKEIVKAPLEDTAKGSTKEVEKAVLVLEDQTKSTIAKSVEPIQGIKCAKGQGEIKRATTSASDSDKVFYLRRAILLCPEEPSLRVDLAKVYGRLGLKDDARREFTSAIEIDPSNETAQEELSIMMLESSK